MGIETIGRGSAALLALLDLTSQGIGPDKLAGEVGVTFEGLSFLGESTFRVAMVSNSFSATPGADTSALLSVPVGRIWIIREVGIFADFTAAELAAAAPALQLSLAIIGFPGVTGDVGGVPFNPPFMQFFDNGAMGARLTSAISAAGTAGLRMGGNHQFTYPLVARNGVTIVGGTMDLSATTPQGDLFVWAAIHDLPA